MSKEYLICFFAGTSTQMIMQRFYDLYEIETLNMSKINKQVIQWSVIYEQVGGWLLEEEANLFGVGKIANDEASRLHHFTLNTFDVLLARNLNKILHICDSKKEYLSPQTEQEECVYITYCCWLFGILSEFDIIIKGVDDRITYRQNYLKFIAIFEDLKTKLSRQRLLGSESRNTMQSNIDDIVVGLISEWKLSILAAVEEFFSEKW